MAGEFNFDDAIAAAQQQIDAQIATCEQQVEFWKGYQAAVREIQRHTTDPEAHIRAIGAATVALCDWMEADGYRTLTGATESMLAQVVCNAYRKALAGS